MTTNLQLKEDIERELNFEPKVNDALICVSVDKGVVSLRGIVDIYAEIWAEEEAIEPVSGVRTVAQDPKSGCSMAYSRRQ